MVDVWLITFNGVWLLSAAVLLAVFSYASSEAQAAGQPLRAVLAERRWQRRMDGALAGVCAGLGLSIVPGWETLVWAILAVAFAWQAIRGGRVA